jgi:hypothetical protein
VGTQYPDLSVPDRRHVRGLHELSGLVLGNPAAPYAINLRFTHALTSKTVDIKVYGDHYMFINNKVFTFASFVTGGRPQLLTGTESPTSISIL